MWRIDERLRMEQELRSSQGGAPMAERAQPGAAYPQTTNHHHPYQLAMLQQQMHTSSSSQAAGAPAVSSALPPPNGFAMLDPRTHQAANSGLQFQGSAADSSRLHVLRLMRLREERQLLEERHALMKQREDLQLQQILKQRSEQNQARPPAASTSIPQASKPMPATTTGAAARSNPNGAALSEEITGIAMAIDKEKKSATITPPVESAASSTPEENKKPPVAAKKKTKAPKASATGTEKPKKSKKKDEKWLSTLEELKMYKQVHGDCIVPRGYGDNPRLASWVAEQRKQYKLLKDNKQSSITQERIVLLNELDFAWNAQEAAWSRHMTDLQSFRAETGHCHVPLNHPQYPKLGLWVKEQRRHYTLMKQGKPSHMTVDRANQLNAVGFCWDTHEATWLERLRELKEYKEQCGTVIVPTNFSKNPKLGTWTHHQRRQYKKFKEGKPCHITEERIKALDAIGFVWNPRAEGKGHKRVPSSDDSADSNSEDHSLASSVDDEFDRRDFRPNKRQRVFEM